MIINVKNEFKDFFQFIFLNIDLYFIIIFSFASFLDLFHFGDVMDLEQD